MPRITKVSQTGAGTSTALVFIRNERPRVAYTINVTGSATYSLQHSLDGTNWVSNEDVTNLTNDADGNYMFPLYGVRLVVASGAGTVTLVLSQALEE